MPDRSELYNRWRTETRRERFVRPGERLGVAVSGGPDSVLLLDFLARLSRDLGFQLAVVHFNHHLRGAESDEDERFVHNLASHFKVAFFRGEARVAEEARKRRRNLEATARDLRYRFFFGLIRQGRLDKVATAHTLDDQAETVLLHILRGTGTKGLGGIHSRLENKIIRPFLTLTRAEVELETGRRNLRFRVDSTNLDLHFRRNKVRMELLPMLEREYNPELKRLLSKLAGRAREDEAYLEQQARERAGGWRLRQDGTERISRRVLAGMPPALVRRILRQMLCGVQGSLVGVTHRHTDALYRFALESQSGKELQLPGGLTARTEFEWLVLSPDAGNKEAGGFVYNVVIPCSIFVREIGWGISFKIVDAKQCRKEYNAMEWPRLDPQKLPASLVLRSWRQGDRYCPVGFKKSVKVKELFRRHRIPFVERALWPVLDSERGIVCARGFPASRWCAAEERKGSVLLVFEAGNGQFVNAGHTA